MPCRPTNDVWSKQLIKCVCVCVGGAIIFLLGHYISVALTVPGSIDVAFTLNVSVLYWTTYHEPRKPTILNPLTWRTPPTPVVPTYLVQLPGPRRHFSLYITDGNPHECQTWNWHQLQCGGLPSRWRCGSRVEIQIVNYLFITICHRCYIT